MKYNENIPSPIFVEKLDVGIANKSQEIYLVNQCEATRGKFRFVQIVLRRSRIIFCSKKKLIRKNLNFY